VPELAEGETVQDAIAQRVREHQATQGVDLSRFDTDQMLRLHQYNVFPNATVLITPDLYSVLIARPGASPEESELVFLGFTRVASADEPRTEPMDFRLDSPDGVDFGTVLNQDVGLLRNAQRGLHQPGLTHLALSNEECRIINMHRNLERYLGIVPSEMSGGATTA
jgi:hypothetical protein